MIAADNICCTFSRGIGRKPIRALDNFSMQVEEGAVFGLLGPNGAGKTTAMHCLLGLIRPDSGDIRVNGGEPYPGSPVFDDMVYLPEEPIYHPYLRVREAVDYYARLYRRSIRPSAIDEALERVELSHFAKLPIAKCSKGMKQKVGLAVCMLFTPRILFLDEPTRGLDPLVVRTFRDYLEEVNRQGATIVLNSHVLSEVELICSRVSIMKSGRVLKEGGLHELVHIGDERLYRVTLKSTDVSLPDIFSNVHKREQIMTAEVQTADLEVMIRFMQANDLRLYSCVLRQETLEDVFMRVIESGEVES